MLLICDSSVVLLFKCYLYVTAMLSYHWRLFIKISWRLLFIPIYGNWQMLPLSSKKDDKQLVKNYRLNFSLLVVNYLKMIFTSLYSYLNNNSLVTHNQSGDSTTNQLLFLVNEIHEAFEDPKSLEVRAVFLDISKAFDKV